MAHTTLKLDQKVTGGLPRVVPGLVTGKRNSLQFRIGLTIFHEHAFLFERLMRLQP